MIYLTGDVHTKIDNWEQKAAGSETDAAIKYLEILKEFKVSATLFINGKCLKEETDKIKKIMEYDVEVGGHTYDNFGGMNLFKSYIYRKLFGCTYGPLGYQKKDISRTKKEFENLEMEMKSWRTHAFGSNENTFNILKQEGVLCVSDLLGDKGIFKQGEIIHVPINIPVDNVTIAYGKFSPENRDPFASCTKGRIKKEEWLEIIKKRIRENEKNKKDSILLIHPITMAALDNFNTFRIIAKFLSGYKSSKISQIKISN